MDGKIKRGRRVGEWDIKQEKSSGESRVKSERKEEDESGINTRKKGRNWNEWIKKRVREG